jgi:hypothetical protein
MGTGTTHDAGTNAVTTGWAEVGDSCTVPAGHAHARVYLTVAVFGTVTATDVYADDASLRQIG